MNKRSYIYLDLGFYGPCNLRCAYCRTDFVQDDGRWPVEIFKRQIDLFQVQYRAGVAKMSGYGEITIWRGFREFLAYVSERMPSVQIITNGTFDSRVADTLLRTSNVSPNLTIDGHTMEMNHLRVYDHSRSHERILENLRVLVQGGKRVEVNCVLHLHNAGNLRAFCDYLAERYDGRVMLFPYPARSFALAPGVGSQVASNIVFLADELESLAEDFKAIMPPRAYIDELREFLIRGHRVNPCYVHWTNLGSGSKNERLHCANYGEELSYGPMDMMLSDPTGDIAQKEVEHFSAGVVGPRCNDCFNHYHVLGAYLDGRITLDELQHLPSLEFPGVREILIEIKAAFGELRGGAVAGTGVSKSAWQPSSGST